LIQILFEWSEIKPVSTKFDVERLFSGFKFACVWISGILLVWLFCHLFIRSCGGPFPYRTRGPFAKEEFKQLGDLPQWESILTLPGLEGETTSERLIKGEDIPSLQFGNPDSATPSQP
jgi:hypothetical protein